MLRMRSCQFLGAGLAACYWAAIAAPPAAYAQKIEEKNVSVHGTITAIDLRKKTLTIRIAEESGRSRERIVAVDHKTKIQRNNQINQRLVHLMVGDKVSLMYRQGAAQPNPALQIIVLTPAEESS